jgi:hypothetical protein
MAFWGLVQWQVNVHTSVNFSVFLKLFISRPAGRNQHVYKNSVLFAVTLNDLMYEM